MSTSTATNNSAASSPTKSPSSSSTDAKPSSTAWSNPTSSANSPAEGGWPILSPHTWSIPNASNASALFQLEGQHNMSRTTTSRKTLSPMTPEAIEAAARADRDAQPLTRSNLKRMKRTPQAKIIRRALGLTQEEFSAHYHIPLGTLRDWEQGRAEPDQPTQAYLKVIAREPERVERLLNPQPER